MRVQILKDWKGLKKDSVHEIKNIDGNLVMDGRTRSGVEIELEGGKKIIVPIDLVEFI